MKTSKPHIAKALVALTLSASFLGAVFTSAAQAHDPDLDPNVVCTPDPVKKMDLSNVESRSAQQFFKQDFKDRQYLLYGDTDHYDLRIHEMFWSKKHLDYLASQGVKHIFIERAPSQSQKGIDDLVAGKITPAQFAKDYVGGKMWERDGSHDMRVKMAKSVIYAASLGISVHASDVKTKGIATKQERMELYKFYGDMTATFNKLCPNLDFYTSAFMRAYMHKMQPYLQENNRGQRFNEIMQERFNDSNRVALIKKIAGNEKSAILYGAAHFSGPKSIQALLGKDNSVHIDLFGDLKALSDYNLKAGNGTDFALVIDQNRLYKFGNLNFEKKPAQPTPKPGS